MCRNPHVNPDGAGHFLSWTKKERHCWMRKQTFLTTSIYSFIYFICDL